MPATRSAACCCPKTRSSRCSRGALAARGDRRGARPPNAIDDGHVLGLADEELVDEPLAPRYRRPLLLVLLRPLGARSALVPSLRPLRAQRALVALVKILHDILLIVAPGSRHGEAVAARWRGLAPRVAGRRLFHLPVKILGVCLSGIGRGWGWSVQTRHDTGTRERGPTVDSRIRPRAKDAKPSRRRVAWEPSARSTCPHRPPEIDPYAFARRKCHVYFRKFHLHEEVFGSVLLALRAINNTDNNLDYR
jgi:hypothetical protein